MQLCKLPSSKQIQTDQQIMSQIEENTPDWYQKPCMLGVDEAGRGPVLGPMVYAVAFCPIDEAEALAKKDYDDSKQLTEDKRDRLLQAIQADKTMGHLHDSLSASYISSQMLSTGRTSLNALAFESTARLIRRTLDLGVNLHHIYVDTVGDPDRYRDRLSAAFPGISFTVCPKADAIYPIVSAASIVAKVTRDKALREYTPMETGALQETMSRKFGSGYPGDPETKGWLENHVDPVFGFPSLVRFSWSTCTNILKDRGVRVRWECEEENVAGDNGGGGVGYGGQQQTTMLGFAAGNDKMRDMGPSNGIGRHSFFRARRLQRVATF